MKWLKCTLKQPCLCSATLWNYRQCLQPRFAVAEMRHIFAKDCGGWAHWASQWGLDSLFAVLTVPAQCRMSICQWNSLTCMPCHPCHQMANSKGSECCGEQVAGPKGSLSVHEVDVLQWCRLVQYWLYWLDCVWWQILFERVWCCKHGAMKIWVIECRNAF